MASVQVPITLAIGIRPPSPKYCWPTAAALDATSTAQPQLSVDMHDLSINLARSQLANQLPCLICFEVPEELPRDPPTPRCKHASQVCNGCLVDHIKFLVHKEEVATIPCPNVGCHEEMDYEAVSREVKGNSQCLDRYEALLLRNSLEGDAKFVWCKSPECKWGQVHESGDNAPIVICQVCQARSCFTHGVPWHAGFTCEEYDGHVSRRPEIEEEERASEEYIKQYTKRCPKESCRCPIEKNQGCDHMTCDARFGCGHEFCWVCLASYEPILREGNHRHEPTCQHYTPL